ncbi:hypothetical protein D8674_021254 [Pyrus ussuriensis x Pyrus communis]|uniref:Peptidase A2 domain-containing protein n=1 Tax=Pyrus ussuriensis x Pyrus communis TaxID=2448454 RepID=A0A5N5GGN2_9ROSA|nr:hypothetical protein D8674_021254 [Pyrus ussuriensis x Pyrus communis]
MAPRSRRNTTKSGNASDAGEDENLDEYDILDIIAAIHALGEAQKQIVAFVKELKNLTPKPSEKTNDKDCTPREKVSQEKLAADVGKGPEKAPSFITQEDAIAMLEKELHRSSEDWKYSYDTPWPQAKGWGDKDANLMDFAPSLSDDDFTIDIPEEYNKEAAEEHVFNQEMMVVTLSLYLEGHINDVFIRQALVDTGSSVNILPLVVLTAAGVPTTKLVRSQISIKRFGNNSEETMGYIKINLMIGPIRSLTKFYMIDINVNKHRLVASTYHQCVKGRIRMRPICIPDRSIFRRLT